MRFAGNAGQAAGIEHQIAVRDVGANFQSIETGCAGTQRIARRRLRRLRIRLLDRLLQPEQVEPRDHAVVHRQRDATIERRKDADGL